MTDEELKKDLILSFAAMLIAILMCHILGIF